jgi:hypothetical protein
LLALLKDAIDMNAIILVGLYLGGIAISVVVLCMFIGWLADTFSDLGSALGVLLIISFFAICFGLL